MTGAIQGALTTISIMLRRAREVFDFRPNLSVLVAIDNANTQHPDPSPHKVPRLPGDGAGVERPRLRPLCAQDGTTRDDRLGETAQRLRRLFDFVRTEPCVLFFDEFDAIGKERGDIHETGEIKRVITTLLLQIDDLPSYCVLVGATNHPELLDRATWRRFEIRLNLDAPTPKQLVQFFNDQLDTLEGQPGYTAKRLCESVNPVSFSEAEAFFLDVRRRIALAQGTRELRSILDDRVKAFSSRSGVNDIGGTDGGKTNPPVS